ncbi:S46 family peptidase [Bacteroides sp. 214]|nr:S46 family peptidase [Bacteroides sp. 214]
MWLLQLMQEQHSIEMMKKQGLKLDAIDIYNPNGVALKDAVGIFGGGCTGEIISPEGLILTNHHCGYGAIQQHSSVEHDYLTNGFWAHSKEEELPTPNLHFTFIERIEDITDVVNAKITAGEITESESFTYQFLRNIATELFEKSDLKDKKGISPQVLPFYAGNKFYMFYRKVYSDVRMVAAPPSSIGKFGGETDNWMWPRHTGDFSIFRIYADANGEPADYNESNIPLKTQKHLTISIKGLEEEDYAMILGFPGSTSRYLTVSEVQERMEAINAPRIQVREERLRVLRQEMEASDKVRIQYSSKFAGSSNYWKNSIGMNKAIIDNDVLGTKAKQQEAFATFAKTQGNKDYIEVIGKIDHIINNRKQNEFELTCLSETFGAAIEFRMDEKPFRAYVKATKEKNKQLADSLQNVMKQEYERRHNKDYDHEVDRKVAKALIPLYAQLVSAENLPDFYAFIQKNYKGNYDKFVDDVYNKSILANESNFNAFIKKPTDAAIDKDLLVMYRNSVVEKAKALSDASSAPAKELQLLRKTYIRGLAEMNAPAPAYPDANFTMRLTYGNVKSYSPKDGVHYNFYTTTKGILEKENPNSTEFVVPAKLKELIENADYGRYALPNGEMPVCFLTNNDITGGNSGSPVLNAKGELIGCAFDGNWESLSGDINFDNKMQRCINLDIRYVLFVIEKIGNCERLINEMTIVE